MQAQLCPTFHPASASTVIRILKLAEIEIIRQNSDGHNSLDKHFVPRVQMAGNGHPFPCQRHVRMDLAINDIAIHADDIRRSGI